MIDKAIMTYIQGSTGCTAVPLLPYKKPNRWELGTKQRDSTTSLLLLLVRETPAWITVRFHTGNFFGADSFDQEYFI